MTFKKLENIANTTLLEDKVLKCCMKRKREKQFRTMRMIEIT